MKKEFRSGCPISSTLDVVGDKWSLLIIRDMLVKHKKTFKQMSDSYEKIAPSIWKSGAPGGCPIWSFADVEIYSAQSQ